jgi:hypothetical protein
MELLRWFVQGLWSLLQKYFALWIQLGASVREAFGLSMPAGVMEAIAVTVGVLLLGGGLVRIFNWDRKGNQPQSITLYTSQTPDQIVAQDRANFVKLVVTAVAVGLGLAVLISTITPPP